MKNLCLVIVSLAVAMLAVAAEKETAGAPEKVTLADLPVAARVAAEKFVAGGTIRKIDKETEDGKVVYDLEATVNGRHVETTIAADGTVLSTEEEVALDSLPKAVRDAAEKYFGSGQGLKAAKELEAGKTSFEVEGKKGDAKLTVKFDDAGKILEEERE